MPKREVSLLIAAALLAVCSACTHDSVPKAEPQQSAAASPAQTAWDALPPPSALQLKPGAPRSASYAEADLTINGADYSSGLPSQRVTVQGSSLVFAPAYAGPAGDYSQVALAIFDFRVPGYDRAAKVRSSWNKPSPGAGEVWYGLANWQGDHWDWWRCPGDFILEIASFEPYLNFSDDLLLVVARTGTAPSTLASVRLGAPLPTAQLTATPQGGIPPMVVELDASASSAAEGEIVKYEFDKGLGVFLDYATDANLLVQYDTIGSYTARVRVTDSNGGQALAAQVITATGPWQHTYLRGNSSRMYGVAVAPNGDVYACGFSHGLSGYSGVCIWKYDVVGNLLWVRGYQEPGSGTLIKCELDQDGNLILCGYIQSSGYIASLQKWSPDGQLLWVREFARNANAELTDVKISGADIFAIGDYRVTPGNNDLVAIRVNPDGTLQWSRRWSWGPDQTELATACARTFINGSEFLASGITATTLGNPPPGAMPIILGWDQSGNLVRSMEFGDGSTLGYINALDLEGTGDATRIVALGTRRNGNFNQQFLVRSNLAGSTEAGVVYSVTDTPVSPFGMLAIVPGTAYLICGGMYYGGLDRGYLATIDPGSLQPGQQLFWDGANAGTVDFYAIGAMPGGGVVIAGGSSTADSSMAGFSGSNQQFLETFRPITGDDLDGEVTLFDPGGTAIELTDGQQDVSATNAAMVRYESLTPQ